MRAWTQGLLLLLAIALAAAGGAGLVYWLQGRRTGTATVPVPTAPPAEAPAPAAPPAPHLDAAAGNAPIPSTEDLLAKAMPAVVVVETASGRGSAFFVDRHRLITNHHVVAGQSYVKVRLADNTRLSASITATAPDWDLALLQLMEAGPDRPFLPLGTVQAVRQGQEVLAIGTPLGVFQNTVTRGIVSSLRQFGKVVVLQTDTALNPGNSGGPLLDHAGRVVGINTMGFRGTQGLNFAVAADHARALMEGRPLELAFKGPSPDAELRGVLPGPSASEADRAREEGTQRYAAQLAAIGRAADQLESAFTTFVALHWEGKVAGGFDRSFYALWEPSALQGKPVQGYEARLASLHQGADQLRDLLRQAEDQARQAGVYPGTRRELRQRYRLDFRGWD